MFDIAADMLWVIGTFSPGGHVIAYSPRMRNHGFAMYNRGDNGRPWLRFME